MRAKYIPLDRTAPELVSDFIACFYPSRTQWPDLQLLSALPEQQDTWKSKPDGTSGDDSRDSSEEIEETPEVDDAVVNTAEMLKEGRPFLFGLLVSRHPDVEITAKSFRLQATTNEATIGAEQPVPVPSISDPSSPDNTLEGQTKQAPSPQEPANGNRPALDKCCWPGSSSSGVQGGTLQGGSNSGGGNGYGNNGDERCCHMSAAQNISQSTGPTRRQPPLAINNPGHMYFAGVDVTLRHHGEQRQYRRFMDYKLLTYYGEYIKDLSNHIGKVVTAKHRVLQKLGKATNKGDVCSAKDMHETHDKDLQWDLFMIHSIYITKGKQVFTEPYNYEDYTLKTQQEQFRPDLYQAYLDFNPEGLTIEMATQPITQNVDRYRVP